MDEDQDTPIADFNPSWMQDGYGISGPQDDYTQQDTGDWDTNAWTRERIKGDQASPPGSGSSCMQAAGDPPGSGTWILGSIDGTCQWIDTTTCP